MNEIPVEHPRREFTLAELAHVCRGSEATIDDAGTQLDVPYFTRPIDRLRVYTREAAETILRRLRLNASALDTTVFTTVTSPLWAMTAAAAAHQARNEAMGDPQAASAIPASALADTAEFNLNK